jgi:type IV pilus assembly protein PilY1
VESFPSLDVDNVWIYFGTGRFFNDEDKLTTDQEYLYGVKDPFFNNTYAGSHQYDYALSAGLTLDPGDLFESDSVVTTTGGTVLDESGNLFLTDGYFNDLVDHVRDNYDGWHRRLETNGAQASERMISKPAIFGGMSFFATFSPSAEICKNDGSTDFYALYYITGTGYTRQILDIENPDTVTYTNSSGQDVTEEVVAVKLETGLIGAPPPAVGLHTGKEEGAKAYIQLSTGVVEEIDVGSAIYMKSTITDWWDRVDDPANSISID